MAFPSGWIRRCKLTVPAAQVSGTHTDITVVIDETVFPAEMIASANPYHALAGGDDIRFALNRDGTNELPLFVKTFVLDGAAQVWVKLPTATDAAANEIWCFYNNAAATPYAEGDTYGKHNAVDSNTNLFLTLDEDAGGGAPQFIDTTSNSKDYTAVGLGSGNTVPVQVGDGLDLSGGVQYITDNDSGFPTGSTPRTFSCWVKRTYAGAPRYEHVFHYGRYGFAGQALACGVDASNKMRVGRWGADAAASTTALVNNTLYRLSWVVTGTQVKYYFNGVIDNTVAFTVSATALAGVSRIGEGTTWFINNWDGLLDNPTFAATERNAGWLLTEYNNQNDPSTFWTTGTPENVVADWDYPGLTQPTIVYNAITLDIPVPLICLLGESAASQENVALDGSTERVNMAYQSELDVMIGPVFDATFISMMKTFYQDWAGQRKYFTLTTGIDTRYDGQWRLKPGAWRPEARDGYLKYKLGLERPAS